MSRGKDMILNIVIDHYTKQIHLFPCHHHRLLQMVSPLYTSTTYFLCTESLRKSLVIGDPSLLQEHASAIQRLGIDAGLMTAYHPQANGQVERKNQEVKLLAPLH